MSTSISVVHPPAIDVSHCHTLSQPLTFHSVLFLTEFISKIFSFNSFALQSSLNFYVISSLPTSRQSAALAVSSKLFLWAHVLIFCCSLFIILLCVRWDSFLHLVFMCCCIHSFTLLTCFLASETKGIFMKHFS